MHRGFSDPGMGIYPLRTQRDLVVVPRGEPICNQWIGGVSTPFWEVSTREIIAFVPDMLKLYMCGGIYDQGTVNYPTRVRQDLDVGYRGNSRSALAL